MTAGEGAVFGEGSEGEDSDGGRMRGGQEGECRMRDRCPGALAEVRFEGGKSGKRCAGWGGHGCVLVDRGSARAMRCTSFEVVVVRVSISRNCRVVG